MAEISFSLLYYFIIFTLLFFVYFQDNKVVGNKANVMLASYHAMEVVLRMLRPGLYKNFHITDMIDRIAAVYSVS